MGARGQTRGTSRRKTKTFLLLILFIVAACLFFPRSRNHPAPLAVVPAATPLPASAARAVALTDLPAATKPPVPHFEPWGENERVSLWFEDGALNPEFVRRYQLSPAKVEELRHLKERALAMMLEIDQRIASTALSDDGRSLTITIKADPPAAKAFTESFHADLRQVLGDDIYNDLAPHYTSPTFDEPLTAGIAEKKITVERLDTPPGQPPKYHLQTEMKLLSTPPELPPAYHTSTSEGNVDRKTAITLAPDLSVLLPKDF